MFAVVQNGEFRQVIQPNTEFSVGDKQYSAKFLRNATKEEREAAGVYEIVYGEQNDQRFYWVDGPHYTVNEATKTVHGSFNSTAKELDDRTETPQGATEPITSKGLKSQWVDQVKDAANKLLAQTDWMVIRKAERGVEIPADVAAKRAAIVAECARLEAAIAGVTNVGQLQTIVMSQNWPA